MGIGKIVKSIAKPVGSLLNSLTGVTDTAESSYKDSVNLMNLENANNIALWNMQNEYNTPAAQMARMKEAGININPMTYAVGNGNMSTTASSVATSAPHMPNYSGAGNPISALMSVMTGIQQIEGMKKDNALKQKAIDNYDNEHRPDWLQIANFLGAVLTGKTYSNIEEIARGVRSALELDKPEKGSIERHMLDNSEWWQKYGRYSSKFGDGTWKKHLLD